MNLKPKSLKLKLDVLLDPNCDNYCRDSASALASKSAPKTFSSDRVDKNTYTSSRTQVDDGQLYVAKLINNKLVCRPISDLLILRPDFSHFDFREESDVKEEVKPISIKFAAADRQANTPGKGVGTSNVGSQQDAAEDPEDSFAPLKYVHLTDPDAIKERETLFGKPEPKVKPDPDAEPIDKKPVIAELIPDIKPKVEKMDVEDIYSDLSQQQASQVSVTQKKSAIFIKQKIKECIFKAKVVSYEEVHQYLRGYGHKTETEHIPINNKEVLDALTEIANLVQGNWVIKSEVLYGDSSERESTDVTGISINSFITARDYLIWLFTQSRIVGRLGYSRSVRLPDYDTLELFNQLARYRSDLKKWEFKLPTDERFLEQFPDVVNRQNTFWKVRRANKLAIFK